MRSKIGIIEFVTLCCIITLVYNGIDMTIDYLDFNYSYKLMVKDNNDGYDLPAISVCTDSHVLFDRNKVIKRFKLEKQWAEYAFNMINYLYNYPNVSYHGGHQDCDLSNKYDGEYFDKLNRTSRMYDTSKNHLNKLNKELEEFFD